VATGICAQEIFTLSTLWSDSFREWEVEYVLEPDAGSTSIGKMAIAWNTNNSWDEWMFDMGEFRGSIRKKLRSNPVIWELNAGFSIISARAVWPNDNIESRITTDIENYTLRSKWGNNPEEWILSFQNQKIAQIYTKTEGDPRMWVFEPIVDVLPPLDVQMMACFLTTFLSTPKQ
jgi:hypothetical protein